MLQKLSCSTIYLAGNWTFPFQVTIITIKSSSLSQSAFMGFLLLPYYSGFSHLCFKASTDCLYFYCREQNLYQARPLSYIPSLCALNLQTHWNYSCETHIGKVYKGLTFFCKPRWNSALTDQNNGRRQRLPFVQNFVWGCHCSNGSKGSKAQTYSIAISATCRKHLLILVRLQDHCGGELKICELWFWKV